MTLGPIGSHPALPSAFRIQTHRLSNIPPSRYLATVPSRLFLGLWSAGSEDRGIGGPWKLPEIPSFGQNRLSDSWAVSTGFTIGLWAMRMMRMMHAVPVLVVRNDLAWVHWAPRQRELYYLAEVSVVLGDHAITSANSRPLG
ncbi:hypothetical protein PDE_02737 [Penicillium oxalicum 114-2]|uniref:Uncharacterized protein n=1 Tax=Penicillium oxalicum (strain 114-2 / CGMCC 5302) TaxID=933388 RepID=S8APF2_PENO1|nr:hypothetical protein PDE_02737 [Penicillium oxalicum 114-2]